jgi:hypothetical protein
LCKPKTTFPAGLTLCYKSCANVHSGAYAPFPPLSLGIVSTLQAKP